MLLEILQGLVSEVAPRKGQGEPGPETDLGFGGYGMTLPEYLTFRHRVEQCCDRKFGKDIWPRTLNEIIQILGGFSCIPPEL